MKPLLLILALTSSAVAQGPEIGAIDFYGVRTVSLNDLRTALGMEVGDSLGPGVRDGVTRLEALPGVEHAAAEAVCCEDGKYTLYIGIIEPGTAALAFDPAPTGQIELPDEIVQAYEAFEAAFDQAVQAGDFAEDDTEGHAYMHFPAARAAQERFVQLASDHRAELVTVLHQSANQEHRAIAAQVLAYLPDKRTVVPALVEATRDPYPTVRNNAVRALALIAGFGRRHPDRGIMVPSEPLVDLLNSLVWTDRNKSSLALMQITETRDSTLLALLKSRALPSLIEMAQWKAMGHATAPLVILGRIAGMPDTDIFAALASNRREPILEAIRQ